MNERSVPATTSHEAQKPTSYREVTIGNYDQVSPEDAEVMLDQAHHAIAEGGRMQQEAMELAAAASRQIAEAQQVLAMLQARVRARD